MITTTMIFRTTTSGNTPRTFGPSSAHSGIVEHGFADGHGKPISGRHRPRCLPAHRLRYRWRGGRRHRAQLSLARGKAVSPLHTAAAPPGAAAVLFSAGTLPRQALADGRRIWHPCSSLHSCRSGGIGRRAWFRSMCPLRAWRFKSSLRHSRGGALQAASERLIQLPVARCRAVSLLAAGVEFLFFFSGSVFSASGAGASRTQEREFLPLQAGFFLHYAHRHGRPPSALTSSCPMSFARMSAYSRIGSHRPGRTREGIAGQQAPCFTEARSCVKRRI